MTAFLFLEKSGISWVWDFHSINPKIRLFSSWDRAFVVVVVSLENMQKPRRKALCMFWCLNWNSFRKLNHILYIRRRATKLRGSHKQTRPDRILFVIHRCYFLEYFWKYYIYVSVSFKVHGEGSACDLSASSSDVCKKWAHNSKALRKTESQHIRPSTTNAAAENKKMVRGS